MGQIHCTCASKTQQTAVTGTASRVHITPCDTVDCAVLLCCRTVSRTRCWGVSRCQLWMWPTRGASRGCKCRDSGCCLAEGCGCSGSTRTYAACMQGVVRARSCGSASPPGQGLPPECLHSSRGACRLATGHSAVSTTTTCLPACPPPARPSTPPPPRAARLCRWPLQGAMMGQLELIVQWIPMDRLGR